MDGADRWAAQVHGSAEPPPAGTAPPDLGSFWTTTAEALARIPPDVRCVARPDPASAVRAYDLSFVSWDHRRIRGYAILWDDTTPRPLIVHAHGYRSQVEPRFEWARAGCHVVGFDIRGFGRSTDAVPAPARGGWLLTGLREPESSVLRGAVCDYVRATQVGTLLGVPVLRRVTHGVSLAGGLAAMAEAVSPRADLLVLGVPTFGWVEGRRLLVERGSGAEVAEFLDTHPQYPEEDLQAVLSYFDTSLLAPAIRCPTLIGIGRVDRVVPYASVRAIADALRAPVEVMTFPVSHDPGPEMAEWERFDRRWLALALGGVPAGFGQPSAAASLTHSR